MTTETVILLIWTIASGNGMAKVLDTKLTIFDTRFETVTECEEIAEHIRTPENWNIYMTIPGKTDDMGRFQFDEGFHVEMRTNCVDLKSRNATSAPKPDVAEN